MQSFPLVVLICVPLFFGIPSMATVRASPEKVENSVVDVQPDKQVYIVHLERPTINNVVDDVEAKHVEILASVVGSREAAKGAMLYSYKHSTYGFSAKLSTEEVASLMGKPGVLAVVPSGTVQLHTGQADGAKLSTVEL